MSRAPSQPRSALTLSLAAALALAACSDKPGPAVVGPGDDTPSSDDTPTTPIDSAQPTDAPSTHDSHGGGNPDASGIWVQDANGVPVGLLVRRGSDDQIADRAIYDIVTVFNPTSGLFFEITMSDGIVRYPQNTFFRGFDCQDPIGIGIGSCVDCKSGYGAAFLHTGRWFKVKGGVPFETMAPDAVFKGGLNTDCIAHGTSNAKGFPVVQVIENAPPTTFAAPLEFIAK
ncbi:MAG: hypothetical protein U1F43_05885 [Myxococcota bacterium]